MSKGDKDNISCFLSSLDANEQMYGTAPRVDVWFLLEYRGSWSRDAVKNSKIPEISKQSLFRYLDKIPNSRLQLIKKHSNTFQGLMFYIAVSDEHNPRLYGLELDNYDDIPGLDISGIIDGEKHITANNLYIICTNGEHDGCCGKLGMPLYRELAESGGYDIWETTHLGGHRFASTIVCLPHGIYYGRVRDLSTASSLFRKYEERTLSTRFYRGRSCYDKDVQAGEYFLRNRTGAMELNAFTLKNAEQNEKKTVVTFTSREGAESHELEIVEHKKSLKLLKSCSDKKPSHVPQFRLESYKSY